MAAGRASCPGTARHKGARGGGVMDVVDSARRFAYPRTVAELAVARGLEEQFLREQGLDDLIDRGLEYIHTPYYDHNGREIFRRRRPGRHGRFEQPASMPLMAYGRWRLGDWHHGHLFLCEGETDTLTCWYHNLPALGLAGSDLAGSLVAEDLATTDRLYICPDNDEAGERFALGVAARLRQLAWPGRAFRLALPSNVKDVNDLHRALGRLTGESMDLLAGSAPVVYDGALAGGAPAPAGGRAPGTAGGEDEPFGPPVLLSALQRIDPAALWLWHGYLACGGVTLLSALWKAGKTTLLAHLLKALEEGGQFCGLECKKARVLYCTEEHESLWAERRDDLRIGDHVEMLVQPFRGKPSEKDWLAFLEYVVAQCGRCAYDLLIFDTISNLWPVRDENDAAKVQEALMPLRQVSDAASLLLVHHLRKSDGQEATASRGSGALPSFADTLIELRRFQAGDRKDRRRVLTGTGPGPSPVDLAVEP